MATGRKRRRPRTARGRPSGAPAARRSRPRSRRRSHRVDWQARILLLVVAVPALAGLAAAVGLGFVAVDDWNRNARLADHGLVTTGLVTDVLDGEWVQVVFTTADGRTFRTEMSDLHWHPAPRVDEPILVRYDAADPADVLQDGRWPPDYEGTVIYAVMALVGAAAAVFLGSPLWFLSRDLDS